MNTPTCLRYVELSQFEIQPLLEKGRGRAFVFGAMSTEGRFAVAGENRP
jgi:hypothetical protein